MPLSAAQCRGARTYIGWTAAEVAEAAGVSIMTVKRLEGGQQIRPTSLGKIAAAFTAQGVTFLAAGEPSPGGGAGFRVAIE